MPRKSLLVLGAAAALTGCATKPVVNDTTPLRPTAVIEKHVTSNGIRGFAPNRQPPPESRHPAGDHRLLELS